MADKAGLQLLPETRKKIDIKMPGENKFLVIGIIFLLLSAIATAGLYYYKTMLNTKIENINTQIADLEKSRNKESEDKIMILNKQLSLISSVIDNHILWTKGFGKLESLVLSQIQITSIAASLNKIEFRANAPSYTAIAKQVAAFYSDQNNSIEDLELGNINAATNGKIEFGMILKIATDKFLKDN